MSEQAESEPVTIESSDGGSLSVMNSEEAYGIVWMLADHFDLDLGNVPW